MISVIIPIYNSENYLEQCIDSLLSQTFSDFELILIDDGSPDKSGEICDAYATKDKRIRVVHKENGGVCTARNVGIGLARGEWICFVDSDDYVKPDYLLLMVENAYTCGESEKYMILTGVQSKQWQINLPNKKIPLCKVPTFIAHNKLPLQPYSKLFKTDVLNKHNIRFANGITNGEDFVFVCEYLRHIDGISCFESREYVYEIQPTSASRRHMKFDEELRNYRAMRGAWESLVQDGGSSEDKQDLLWYSGVQTRFAYLLKSIFYNPMPNLKEQLSLLRYLDNDISDFSYNAQIVGKLNRIARYLLRKRFYLTYIFFNRFITLFGKYPAA